MAADNHLAIHRAVAAILLCYPILLLTVKGGMNGLYFLLLITSLFYLFRTRTTKTTGLWDAYSIAFAIAMASPLVAIFLSQAYHGDFAAREYDGPSRFLLAVPMFLALRQIKASTLSVLQYGLALGAISAFFVVMLVADHQQYFPRASNNFLHPIHFGDLALILGFLSVFSINWTGRDAPFIVALKSLGLLAGMYASVQSQSRGGWVAIPVILLAWLFIRNKQHRLLHLSVATASIILLGVIGYFSVSVIQHRMNDIYSDVAAAWQGNLDTSLGIRFQLWKTALHLFMENPLFGVGPDGFAPVMSNLQQSGAISELTAQNGRSEVHNFIIGNMAKLGIFGLFSALAVFLAPLIIFLRVAQSGTQMQKRATMMGICLVLGFFVFGLSVEIYNYKMVAAFYSLTLAVLLAAATNRTTA